jgi:hypothetical protein
MSKIDYLWFPLIIIFLYTLYTLHKYGIMGYLERRKERHEKRNQYIMKLFDIQ